MRCTLQYLPRLFRLLRVLDVIRERLVEDQEKYRILSERHYKLLDRIIEQFEGREYRLSPDEQREHREMSHWETKLMLDTETFFMFARVLMDKLAKLAVCLINRKNISLPTESFTHHKEWLLRPENIPFQPNEQYGKIVRSQTNWYDLAVTGIRDKTIAHGSARMRMISYPDYRITKAVRISSFADENDQIILVKRKYENEYPDLKGINNLWEVLQYLLSHDIKLSNEDKQRVISIIQRTGSVFPEITLVFAKIADFLQHFGKAFSGYPLNN